MNKYANKPLYQDEVDEIVDALVADPTRAGDVKALLRSKIAAPDVVHMAVPRKVPAKVAPTQEELEDDIWDNMPV